jgi:hypothetical protein
MADTIKEDDDIKVEEGKLEDEKVEIELTEDEDQRLASSDDSDGDREAIRERRRKEKLERKDRRDKAISRDKLELEFLRDRNDDLERRISAQEYRAHQTDLSAIDYRLQEAINEAQMAERVIAKAVEAGNGEDVTQAMRYRDAAISKAQQIQAYKQQQQNYTPPVQQQTAPDDTAMQHAREFIEDNSWYDPTGKDEDSAIVLAIDNALVNSGFDPKSEEYWDELRDRVKRRLPEKFAGGRQPRGGPAVGSGREHAPTSTRREVYISPERKQALVDAGVWDDPVLRQKYIKRYMEYDRENRA